MIAPGIIVFDEDHISYEVLEMVGHGGFGFVYKIRKTIDGSFYALKTLPTNFHSTQSYQAFINECQMALKVKHTNVLQYIYVHNGDTHSGLPPYLIMEYANNGNLLEAVKRHKEAGTFFEIGELKNLYLQLIEGMKSINEKVVHRDIKLDNILIKDGILKIADFGISKATNEGTRQITFKGAGHLKYTAPERWRNETNTVQNDIYSMGIVFYELATLQHPYNVSVDDAYSWQQAHFFQNAKPIKQLNSNIPNGIVQMIASMMEKNVVRRFKNWKEIEEAIQIDDIPSTVNSSLIDNLVSIRVNKDDSSKTQQLERERIERERVEYIKEINYQFHQEIYLPLREFIEEFNNKYAGGKITLNILDNFERERINLNLNFPSGAKGVMEFETLFDKDFEKTIEDRFLESKRKVIQRPKVKNQLIVAWGLIEVIKGRGFNIILTKEEGDFYGNWYLMKNKVSGFYQKPKELAEPFAVDLNELEKVINELNVIGAKVDSEIVGGDSFIQSVNEIIAQYI
ncbi:serine/threonine-protein kinase [uncultured Brevibacillus sp.]|uniref:serine/threonine-protein kinase n=1 Tax=uncultured Brevibacillus sp. TaxID=169970 RepID=UPI00259A5EC2|nr:serine/threonine-protein kinase [uncultured Brevibacillus sp.]